MNKSEIADKQEEVFEWMEKKGYDRRFSKEVSEIIALYLSENSKDHIFLKEAESLKEIYQERSKKSSKVNDWNGAYIDEIRAGAILQLILTCKQKK